MKNFTNLIILHLLSILFHVKAQAPPSPDGNTNVAANLIVVVGVISIIFAIVFILLIYAKVCYVGSRTARTSPLTNLQNRVRQIGLARSSSRFSGIDQTVIDALPFFKFSSLKGSREGLECAICLSKFEDIEILRLLPKCKHAFHINCIDLWLEKHSSCPICRNKITHEDLAYFTHSSSMRYLFNNQSGRKEDDLNSNNIEVFVEREEDRSSNLSRSRKLLTDRSLEEKVLITKQEEEVVDEENNDKVFHKHYHKIIVSDFVFMNRWSNLTSSDLMFLSTEMLGEVSSNRFSSSENEIVKIKEEMEMKRSTERKGISPINDSTLLDSYKTRRSTSEFSSLSRFGDMSKNKMVKGINYSSSVDVANHVEEERARQLWLPIAKRTVQWFANRERRPHQEDTINHNSQEHELDV